MTDAIKKYIVLDGSLHIPKNILNVEMDMGADAVINEVSKLFSFQEMQCYILSYDTKDFVVMHKKQDLYNVLKKLDDETLNEFYSLYDISHEIHDCMDLMNDILAKTIKTLNSDALKYFSSIEDICISILIDQF